MNAITAQELALIRQDALVALDTPCGIQRMTRTDDGMGSSTEVYNTINTVLAGFSQPNVSQLQNFDFLVGAYSAWQVKLPIGTDVKAEDQLVAAGQTLTVQVVLTPRSYSALLTVLATEIKHG